ncbi:MAG: tRNA (adenosine(37)-N6)-dimethylallyltransferase MiaA, partial [Planctomycetota bacterium]|nr:tRNA (adenosine(37)-N6)-dimethylallyltransferase MiaA [Planctomycetota bacterium]
MALICAQRCEAEIVSVDSMKIYRGLEIGTAKPSAAARAQVPHHCLDLADPDEEYNVAKWVEAAQAAIADIARRG